MANKRFMSRFFAFLLVVGLALPITSITPTRAQGVSRTFPETGKTVTDKFLTYWDGHGGLAQEGFPISDAIVERSNTNGNIYIVQYFERAVFEYHPEEKPPYDTLLQLLGTFLYGRKYSQGAPGQQANTSAGSALFKETGKRLGGIFQQYWNTHGGLAQQGFPISDEFDEKNDLDGNIYRVQYFERAVFEYHPEQKDPKYQVLLSQLGTFRSQARYGVLIKQLSGTGDQQTAKFPLKAGLTVFQSLRALDGYYYINLIDAAGKNIATIAASSGPSDYSSAVNIPADGVYGLDVGADTVWTVNVSQPRGTFSTPPPQQKWSGRGWQATPLISLNAGKATFHVVGTGKGIVSAILLDQNGVHVETLAEEKDNVDVTKTINVPADGVYLIQALFDDNWTIEVQQ